MRIVDTASLVKDRARLRNASLASAIAAAVFLINSAMNLAEGDWSVLPALGFGLFFAVAIFAVRSASKAFAVLCPLLFIAGYAFLFHRNGGRHGSLDLMIGFGILIIFFISGARVAFGQIAVLRREIFRDVWVRWLLVPRQPLITLALAVGALAALLAGVLILMGTRGPTVPFIWQLTRQIPAGPYVLNTVAFALFALSGYAFRRVKQHLTALAPQVRARDGRPPVLLLRSFGDDMIVAEAGQHSRSFEEILTKQLWQLGPVIAIGRPGEPLPPLGAAREYVSSDAWRDKVDDLSDEARLIVLIPGRTEGIVWEIRQIREFGRLTRTVIVIPPLADKEVAQRLGILARELGDPKLLDGVPLDRVLAIVFPDGATPVGVTGRHRLPRHYNEAMILSASLLPTSARPAA